MNFTPRSDIVVVGTNPENADYDNPRGRIYGERWVVSASNDHGDTFEFGVDGQEQAVVLAERLQARFDNLGKLPVGFDRWTKGRAIYGSDAYIEYGQDEDLAMERRELAGETF